jgi:hypothetical protein
LFNKDDAKSTRVQIFYETANPEKDKTFKDKIARIKYKNNGFIFRSEDWDRLRKIAEGNPDEQKVYLLSFFSLIDFFFFKKKK